MRRKVTVLVLLISLSLRQVVYATDLTSLTKEQKDLKAEISEVTDKILEYEDEIQTLNEEIESNEKKIKDLQSHQSKSEKNMDSSRESLGETLVMMQRVNNTNLLTTYFYDEETEDNNYFLKLENINRIFVSVAEDMQVFIDEIKNYQTDIDSIDDLKDENEAKLEEINKKIKEQYTLESDLKQQLAEVEDEIGKVALTTTGTASSSDKEAIMSAAGISSSDYQYVDYIISKESGWNATAANPTSSAYGLCQSLPGSKMASAGSDWQTNPVTQMKWCNGYATSRYGSWSKAYSFWISNHWW